MATVSVYVNRKQCILNGYNNQRDCLTATTKILLYSHQVSRSVSIMRLIVVQECLLMSVLNQSCVHAAPKVTMWFTGYSVICRDDSRLTGVSCVWVGKNYCLCQHVSRMVFNCWLDLTSRSEDGKKSHTCTIVFLLELIRSVCLWWWLELRLHVLTGELDTTWGHESTDPSCHMHTVLSALDNMCHVMWLHAPYATVPAGRALATLWGLCCSNMHLYPSWCHDFLLYPQV